MLSMIMQILCLSGLLRCGSASAVTAAVPGVVQKCRACVPLLWCVDCRVEPAGSTAGPLLLLLLHVQ
jgi:hypothetical protein